ncbi:MAG: hypothetical protein JSU77_02180 [Fidelibacterota bacterium]|nr:MAG: hypothetical protein JSU77_02180 [Candidatus Neomarinimicrobiota bacterium]
MPLELPSFINTKCVGITACATIELEDNELAEGLKDPMEMTALYEIDGKAVIIHVHTGKAGESHLHIDCVLSSYYDEEPKQKEMNTIDEVSAFILKLAGSSVAIGTIGGFIVPLNELPEHGTIRSLSAEKRTGDMSITLTGAKLAITGAPIERVEWEIFENKEHVFIAIYSNKAEILDEQYLTRVAEWVEAQFYLFIKGQTSHDKT